MNTASSLKKTILKPVICITAGDCRLYGDLVVPSGAHGIVIQLNRGALAALECKKELRVIPGATHLFEERGTLEQVARISAEWFCKYLADSGSGKEHP